MWDDDQTHHHFQFVERTSGKAIEEPIEIHTMELSKYNMVRTRLVEILR